MKTKLTLLILFLCYTSFGQNGKAFKSNQQLYLKGNSALIGNTILGPNSREAYNSFDKFNDALDLKYIDVDNDKSTFSSSQAKLNISSKSKIKYAALYWSAIYKYDKGIKTSEGKYIIYKEKDKRLGDLNKILFKTPKGKYQPINGTVIFDSNDTDLFEDTKPYVCYADVTKILQNTSALNGTYTVANVKATQGYIYGGSSGGWLLYVVYENNQESLKYFTTYNGFIGVDEESLTINFNDFKTNETGEVKTSLIMGSLEGDHNFKTDRCEILSADKEKFVPLSTPTREENNFFNSTITSTFLYSRTPNSANTLGFDILKMDIPNQNNSIISNNLTETSIKLSTKKDGFYLFFVAFETEISEDFSSKKNEETLIVNTEKITETPEVTNIESTPIIKETTEEKLSIKKDTITVNETTTKPEKIIENTKPIIKNTEVTNEATVVTEKTDEKPVKSNPYIDKQRLQLNREPTLYVAELPVGYYLVTNVFSVEKNATNWLNTLINKGFDAKIFINPKNNWHYVYILNDTNPEPIINEKKRLLKAGTFKDLSIKKINF